MKKGFSLIGFLVTMLLIGILLKLMLAPYQQQTKKSSRTHIQTKSQAKQTVDNVRATLERAQKAAARRAEGF